MIFPYLQILLLLLSALLLLLFSSTLRKIALIYNSYKTRRLDESFTACPKKLQPGNSKNIFSMQKKPLQLFEVSRLFFLLPYSTTKFHAAKPKKKPFLLNSKFSKILFLFCFSATRLIIINGQTLTEQATTEAITVPTQQATTDDGIIDQSSIDLSEDSDTSENTSTSPSSQSPKKNKNNKALQNIQSEEVIQERIEALGNKLAPVEQPQITQSNSSSFTYKWFRPINADALIPGSTITYNVQLFDSTKRTIITEFKIDESSEEFISTKEFKKRQVFINDLEPATNYFIKVSSVINEDRKYQSSTNKIEVFTEPNSIRNFKLFRPEDSPSTSLSARWFPPEGFSDLQGVQYELGIQGAPKKTYKWDLNDKTTMTPNFAWEGLTTGQKYFIRIRVNYAG